MILKNMKFQHLLLDKQIEMIKRVIVVMKYFKSLKENKARKVMMISDK